MQLYSERGFDSTTVAQIAQAAGLTERTFFRHFADKREVLFWGAEALQDFLVQEVEAAPPSSTPLDALAAAFVQAATVISQQRRDLARRRHAIITANAELQERELVKMSRLAGALAAALGRRGLREPDASLAAEVGVALFKVAFESWVRDTSEKELAQVIRETLANLRAVAT